MTYATDLIASARKLLTGVAGEPPSSSDCNRAISTAYYAMFDCLCRLCADHIVGPTEPTSGNSDSWVRVYRSLDHKQVCEAVLKIRDLEKTSQIQVEYIGVLLKSVLEARGEADYNCGKNFNPIEANRLIGQADVVVELLQYPEPWKFDLDAFTKSLTVELFSRKRR